MGYNNSVFTKANIDEALKGMPVIVGMSHHGKTCIIDSLASRIAVEKNRPIVTSFEGIFGSNASGGYKKGEIPEYFTNIVNMFSGIPFTFDLSTLDEEEEEEEITEDAEFEVIETPKLPSRRHIIQCSYCGEDKVPYNKDEGCDYCVDCYDAAHEKSRNTEL